MDDLKHKIKLPRGKLKSDDKQKELTIKLALAEETSRKAFLLADEINQHWLELLGFQLFKKPVVAQSVEVESDVVGTQSLQKAVRIGLFTELSSPSSSIEKLRKVA